MHQVLLHRSALAEARFARGEEVERVIADDAANHVIAVGEIDTNHARRRASHDARVVLIKADGHSLRRGKQHMAIAASK